MMHKKNQYKLGCVPKILQESSTMKGFRTAARQQTPRSSSSRTWFGSAAALSILTFTGSVFAWPLADVYGGPALVSRSASRTEIPSDRSSLKTMLSYRNGRDVAREALADGRPVIYCSLQSGNCPHTLLFALIEGVYGHLGITGTIAQSMGIWWIVLFDVIMGHDPSHTRAVNMAIVLGHVKRGLRRFERTPLVVFDHMDDLVEYAKHSNDSYLSSMSMTIAAWSASAADEGVCDVVFCSKPTLWSRKDTQRIHDLQAYVRFAISK